jgi:predicted transcriptional regulator
MSAMDELISRKRASSKSFEKAFIEESERLEAAYALMRLREEEGLSQQQLAALAGKPQSTIARIENGNMNASVGLLGEIAASVGRALEIRFPAKRQHA